MGGQKGETRGPGTGDSLRVMVITPFEDREWTWLSHHFAPGEIEWTFRNGQLFGKRPWWWLWYGFYALRNARRHDVIITHAPYMTLYVALAMRCLRLKVPHLAFSFNHGNRRFFQGWKLRLFRSLIPDIDLFVVYSMEEARILGELYGIPQDRFCFQHWAVQPPQIEGNLPDEVLAHRPYVACIGKNNRDFPAFLEAVRELPVNAIVVCPSAEAARLQFPDNVLVFSDISLQLCNEIVHGAIMNVIPIRDASTGAGHMTIVAGMHLGKAQVVTRLPTIDDYFFDGVHGICVEPNSAESLKNAMDFLLRNPSIRDRLGVNARAFSEEWLQEPSAARGLKEILSAFRSGEVLPSETSGWTECKTRLRKQAIDVFRSG